LNIVPILKRFEKHTTLRNYNVGVRDCKKTTRKPLILLSHTPCF
jgi:hypothetical protein